MHGPNIAKKLIILLQSGTKKAIGGPRMKR
jgi:hypothetical protein